MTVTFLMKNEVLVSSENMALLIERKDYHSVFHLLIAVSEYPM
jgi:hypothetical protein